MQYNWHLGKYALIVDLDLTKTVPYKLLRPGKKKYSCVAFERYIIKPCVRWLH